MVKSKPLAQASYLMRKKFNKFNFQDLNLAYIYNCVLNDMKKKIEKQ